jgi:hypothetical protein
MNSPVIERASNWHGEEEDSEYDSDADSESGDYRYNKDNNAEKERPLAAVSELVRSGGVEDAISIDEECPIRHDKYEDPYENKEKELPTRLACGHIIGSECLTRWLCENNSCPICRRNYGDVL